MKRVTVKCELCGQDISKSNIGKHLDRHINHPESFKDKSYIKDTGSLNCQFCGKLFNGHNALHNHEVRCCKNPLKIDSTLPDCTGKDAWNKGLTKQTDERVAKYAASNSSSVKNRRPRGPLSEESKRKISDTINKKVANGEWHTTLSKDKHFKYKGIDLHCSWELSYAKYLDANGIMWKRCDTRFRYVFEGKNHYYTPDFYLPETDEFVEIKGFKTSKDEAKWAQFPADKTLLVLMYNDLKDLGVAIT